MPPFDAREPINALTHAIGLVAAFPVAWLLVRASLRRPRTTPAERAFEDGKAAALAVFGFGMAACYAASTAYHAFPGDAAEIARLRRFDLVGIFLLIAGTFTPAAWSLMRPRPRRVAMALVWGTSAICSATILIGRPMPTLVATSIYLGLGWGMVACYADIRRDYDPRTLRLLPVGGAFYSLGAIINLSDAPRNALGIGPHEVFHTLVLCGTAAHVVFLARVAVPAPAPVARPGVRPEATGGRRNSSRSAAAIEA